MLFPVILLLLQLTLGSVILPGKPTRYLVQLKKPLTLEKLCTQDDEVKATRHVRSGIERVISFGTFEGLVGEFSGDVVKRLSANPLIERITPDIQVHAVDYAEQENAPAHLVRLSQDSPVDVEESLTYLYDPEKLGEGVNIYVVDTGVFVDHPDFEGRAVLGPNFSTDVSDLDYVGHGTHVAGLAASKTYGVAKKATVVSVKALDRSGQGTLSQVISALEFCVEHRAEAGVPGVVNLSLGSRRSEILDSAVAAALDSGLVVTVAAGNNNRDACRMSPAGSPSALTVGAINDKTDRITSFSNYGRCVDVFSSGEEVVSLTNNPYDYTKPVALSGTSLSSPIVAGLSAVLLGSGVDAADLKGELVKISEKGVNPKVESIVPVWKSQQDRQHWRQGGRSHGP